LFWFISYEIGVFGHISKVFNDFEWFSLILLIFQKISWFLKFFKLSGQKLPRQTRTCPSTTHRPLIDHSSTTHRPLIDQFIDQRGGF